jgi:hypothetical protein
MLRESCRLGRSPGKPDRLRRGILAVVNGWLRVGTSMGSARSGARRVELVLLKSRTALHQQRSCAEPSGPTCSTRPIS